MPQEILDAEIKTRLPQEHKNQLVRIAVARHLRVSDILREAVREKLASLPAVKPKRRQAA